MRKLNWFPPIQQPFVTGDAGNLQLQDLNGNAITDAVQHDISQDGQVVAKEHTTIA
jgi:hypothetical protein